MSGDDLHKERARLKKAEDLQAAGRRLKDLEGMQGRFLDLVSHELRTPLTLIKGYVHLLERVASPGEANPALADCTRALAEASDRLDRLVGELLTFSEVRAGPGELVFREVDLAEELERVVEEVGPLARRREVRVDLELPSQGCSLWADPERLREAVMHLVKNAVQYHRTGGRVSVRLTPEALHAVVRVEDNGPGIDPAHQQRVLDPFYQVGQALDRRSEGLGLGLPIARQIVHAHGGTMTLDSAPGRGTTLTLRLPLEQPSHAELPPLPGRVQADRELWDYVGKLHQGFEAERARLRHLEEVHRVLERTYLESLGYLLALADPGTPEQYASRSRVSRMAVSLARRAAPELLTQPEFHRSVVLLEVSRFGSAQSLLMRAGHIRGGELSMVLAQAETARAQSMPVVRAALVALRHLHERWDGRGYPDRLKGEEIPLISRVLAVADAMDHLLGPDRVRPEMDPASALREVSRLGGTWFDPRLTGELASAWEFF